MKISKLTIFILSLGFSLSTYAADGNWSNEINLGNTGIKWQQACHKNQTDLKSIDFKFINTSDQKHCINYRVEKPGDGAGKLCLEPNSSKIIGTNHNGHNGCRVSYMDWDVIQ